jgi:beta-lactam-binding protein with PASTA domain
VTYQPPPGTAPVPICKVPKTKGTKLPAAEKALRRAHCKVGRVKKVGSRSVRNGRVTRTSPPAGRKLRAGWKIELFVSNGSRK